MGLDHLRVGHAAAAQSLVHKFTKRASSSCSTGGFYKSPTNAQQVDSTSPFNITWDTSCLTSTAVDIYLYAPGTAQNRLHVWQTVNYALGTYEATLEPKWWNDTSSIQLQLGIVTAGTPPFMTTLPAGPVFTATYTPPASGSTPSSADTSQPGSAITNVNNFSTSKTSLSPGKTAAAVIMPILIVIALVLGYLKFSRARARAERKRWSHAIDKRMSTISTDWKSMSAAGASAAIRNSIAVSGTPGSRNSSFSFGAIRPASAATLDSGQAGIGSRTVYTRDNAAEDGSGPQMSQRRPGVGARAGPFAERVSRVSFATDPRPSTDSRRVGSRAFHSAYIPPVPQLNSTDTDTPRSMSPTQTAGPLTLTSEDIRARISGQEHLPRPSMDELMPALSMMRHGGDGSSDEKAASDFLFSAPAPPLPQPPSPTHSPTHPKSPVGMMPMQPMPANVMSPDEMLRAYAERRQTMKSATGIPCPAPVAHYNGNGMRTLYSPTSPVPPGGGAARESGVSAASRYSATVQEAYVGTAE